jgi:hypothetical protein
MAPVDPLRVVSSVMTTTGSTGWRRPAARRHPVAATVGHQPAAGEVQRTAQCGVPIAVGTRTASFTLPCEYAGTGSTNAVPEPCTRDGTIEAVGLSKLDPRTRRRQTHCLQCHRIVRLQRWRFRLDAIQQERFG